MNKLPSELLEELMSERGWTQAELARRAGRSRGLIHDVVNYRRSISTDLAIDLAKAFEIPPDMLFQKLGLFPESRGNEDDNTLKQINYIYSTLRLPESKDKVLEFIKFLKSSEKKEKKK